MRMTHLFLKPSALPFTSALAGYALLKASGICHGITSVAPISLEGKTYSWDLGCMSLRSAACWHTLERAALCGEPWVVGRVQELGGILKIEDSHC